MIFFKPRAMRLFADRDSFMTSSYADLTTGRYVVLVNDNARADQIAPNEISHCHPALEITEVYRQQGFVVYSILSGP